MDRNHFDGQASGITLSPKAGRFSATRQPKLAVVIPALDEEESIGVVVHRLISTIRGLPVSCRIVVADNGSTDSTVRQAEEAGAETVHVPTRGYGAACAGALHFLGRWPDVLIFMDADGSSRPEEIGRLLDPVLRGEVDMVLGVRSRNAPMTLPQRWGTQLAIRLVNLRWGIAFRDMGPFRCILRESLECLNVRDRSWGWTIEMQIQAIRCGLTFIEVPVSWEKRLAGESKISGTVQGVIRAGLRILWTVLRLSFKSNQEITQKGSLHND